MNHNTRKTICIPTKNYLKFLSLAGNVINSKIVRILFCSNILDDNTKKEISQCFKSSNVEFFDYSKTIEDNEIFYNTYQICIVKDFESNFNLIPFFIQNVQENGILLLISNEISTKSNKINYKLSRFSKRFFNQLLAKTNIATVTKFEDDFVKEFNECQPLNGFTKKSENDNNYPIDFCRTSDQELALKTLIKSFESTYRSQTERSVQSSVTIIEGLTGRGKATVVTLGIASAIKFGLADIYIIGPHGSALQSCCGNLKTFLLSLGYEESSLRVRYQDKYFILEVVAGCTTHKVRFINFDQEFTKYDTGLLCVLDAGRLSTLKINKMLSFNPKLVWATITTGGFNSTGSDTFHRTSRPFKSFCGVGEVSLDEMSETVTKSGSVMRDITNKADNKQFTTIFLNNPIIYSEKDDLEGCLNDIFCLQRKTDPKTAEKSGSNFLPDPSLCELMYVNKATLFSGHAAAEILLERFMNVYTSYDHKRSSNFLKELADDQAHHLFCLQQPSKSGKYVPEILCIAHIVIEDQVTGNNPTIMNELRKNTSLDGLKNGKSLRIALLVTQSKFKKRGYGRHMLKMLHRYFLQNPSSDLSNHVFNWSSDIHTDIELKPINEMPKLLMEITEMPPAPFKIDYISCQFPASYELLCFWKKCEYFPVQIKAISQSQMLCTMIRDCSGRPDNNLDQSAYQEMCETVGPVLLHDLRDIDVTLAHEVLFHRNKFDMAGFQECSLDDISQFLDKRQLKKLDSFVQNVHTFESIQDIIHSIARIYFSRRLSGLFLPQYQELTLVGFGLQLKSSKQLATEMILMERYQNTKITDPFTLRKDVQNKIPKLLSHIRECARVFLNYVTRIIDDHHQNGVPEKKRRLM